MKILQDIDIKYYENGEAKVRYTAPVTSSAVVHFELMNSHYCKLSFDTAEAVYFQIGDFIETSYGRFELVDMVRPTHDGGTYTYDLQFEAYYRKWKNRIFKYLPKSSSPEASFNLTSNIKVHAQIIIDNLAALARVDKTFLYDYKYEGDYTDFTFVVDASVDVMEAKAISYSDSNILDALTSIADEFECEWWVEGNIIHFGTCENTNEITDFTINDNVVDMTNSESSSTYATRVFAFGAEKNIPYSYYNDADVDVTKSGVVQRRLMLPTLEECSDENRALLDENGFELTTNGCLQIAGLNPDQYVEGVTTNDDIYPKNTIKVGKVEKYTKNVDNENNDGTTTTVERTFYRVSDLEIVNDDGEKTGEMAFRKECILSNKTLHIMFQSGTLNGLDFECAFNPKGVPEILYDDNNEPVIIDGAEQINPESQCFEIVANEDYGRFLPDTILYPKEGDVFVLYNWDATKMSVATDGTTKYYADVTSVFETSILTLTSDMEWDASYYTEPTDVKIATGTTYKVRLSVGNVSVYGVIGKVIAKTVFQAKESLYNETRQNLREFYEAVQKTNKVYFEAGIDTSVFPNKVIVSGTSKSSALVTAASNELLTDAIKNLKKTMIDPSTYTCKMDATYIFNKGKGRQFGEGDRINLYNKAFFDTYRESRVIGYEIRLDIPFQDAQYTIGEKPSYSKLNAMDSKIEELVFQGQSYIGASGSGGTSTYIIKSYDSTSPTEYNVYSARATEKHFMQKDTEDTATAKQNFEKDIQVEGEALLHGGATFGHDYSISSDGSAVLGDTTAKDVTLSSITSKDYAKELFKGFSLAPGANGSYKLEVGDLEVWGKASFAQLEIRKVSYAGGTVVYSNAGSTLKRVANVTDADGNVIAYKCWAVADDGTTQTMNWWTVGMMALCQTFNVQDGTNTDQAANHYYWRLVIGKGQETLEDGKLYDYILLSNKKTFTGSDAIVPVYTDKCWAEENSRVIIFGSVAVAQCDRAMGTMADGCDVSTDDGGTAVSSRTFYGYADGSDAPQADDVIVQVGDQVSWLSKGNLVMITTYNLNAKGNVPSISMYHSLGNLYAGSDGTANPYQWKTLTHLFSPKKTLVNSECFQFFTDTEDNASTLTQTARQISLSVSEKAIGRRNMLVGSAARAYGEGWAWMNGGGSYGEQICEQIDTENGVDGTHALHCYSVKTGTDAYINAGFHWVGGAPQGNIKVEKGKSYTISFYAKATDLEKVCFVLEAIYEGSATDSSRPAGYAGPTGFSEAFSVDNNNTWQLITKTISVPSDAAYEYLEICLFVRAKADTTGLHDGWLCRPMMEEGSVYNGWTQSTGDSDYLTSSDMKRAGIDIDSDSVTLYGSQVKVKNGDTTAALFTDGRISGDYLNVSTIVSVGSDGSKVVIANGLISIYGTKNPTIPQIKFGVDSDGNAIMNYYDDSGLLLYGLGPDGMSSLDVETGSLTAVTFMPAGSLNFTPSGTATVFKSTLGTVSETYNVVDSDTDNKLFRTHVSQKLSAWNKTVTLYKYRAPRVNGKIISDSGTGRPTTAALAEAADGCYFTSNLLICQSGALVNLASDGTYYSDAVPSDRNGKSIGTLKQYEVYDSPRYLIVLYGTKLISGAPSSAASVGQILASRDTYQQVGTGFDPVIDSGTVSGSDTLVASDDSE